ncbi:MAG: 4'-phosphopantetheinyl transferase superfamily protein [Chloroflexi bacterium]|nr:4'-phosphopantetheinyl transferase superfamily protein [Chloroflexota bacterium]
MLRMLLAKYMHCAPHSLQIEITDSGKPYSAESSAPFFNVSHSGQMIAIAFSRNHPLGIDVEAIRSLPDAQKLAERYFFPREAEILKRLPSEEQGRFFFDCWVHKEAYMKALGKGFALSLRSFEVTDEQTQPFISPDDYRAWYYYPLHPAPGYVGALFIGDRAHEIRCWQID